MVHNIWGEIVRDENSAQRGSFGPDIPADIPPKTSVRPSKSWKNKHFGTDIPRGRPWKNFGLKNFGLIFRALNRSMGETQSRRKRTSTHEWPHESAHESPHERWFPCFQPFEDSPRKLPWNIPRRCPRKGPRVDGRGSPVRTCFHLFCSLPTVLYLHHGGPRLENGLGRPEKNQASGEKRRRSRGRDPQK